MVARTGTQRSVALEGEEDARIEDYVNDKLQTHADLESVDVLLENVRIQHDLLKQQLESATQDAEAAAHDATKHTKIHAAQVQKWRQRQNDIDRRTKIITSSSTSDEAVGKLEPVLRQLQHLEMASGMVDMLVEVDRLGAQVQKSLKSSPREALAPYLRVRHISNGLKQAQPAAEDAAPHLVDWVESSAAKLYDQIKEAYMSDFTKTLSEIKWPSKELNMDEALVEQWTENVERLLELQEPGLKRHDQESQGAPLTTALPTPLLALEVMARPLELGFKYHFEGEKPTNRPDKPEYFLSYIVNLLNTCDEFFAVYLQPILVRRFKDTVLSLNPLFIDSTSAWITAVLPILQRKLRAFIPRIATQPRLLSHLIHELMSFDAGLRDEWGYTGGSVAEDWRGLTWEVLVKDGWFPKWLQVEKEFALERYESIIAPADSGEIDFESVDPGITKPTKAAIRVNDLLETITDRYRNLSSFSQKLKFLIDIQISIFDKFHSRLHGSLEAYLSMTSSIGRTVQGVSKEDQAELLGLSGLDRLCRLYGSSEYLEKKMQDWSEDVFFVELWDELEYRARNGSANGRSGGTIGGNLTVAQVAERTSSGVGSEDESGGLFDETSSAYRRLRVRTEEVIIDTLTSSTRYALRAYSRSTGWAALGSSTTEPSGATEAAQLAPSAELDSVLQHLDTSLGFLARVLSETALRRIARKMALAVQSWLWDSVLMRNHFSVAGTLQFRRDLAAVQALFDQHVGLGQGAAGLRKVVEAIVLLSLPEGKARQQGLAEEDADADAWGLDADADADEQEATHVASHDSTTTTTTTPLTRTHVEAQMFRDNESARTVLEQLGLVALSEGDARNVLGRRVGA